MNEYINLKLYEQPVTYLTDQSQLLFNNLTLEELVNVMGDKSATEYSEIRQRVECLETKNAILKQISLTGNCRILTEFNGDGINRRTAENWLDWLNSEEELYTLGAKEGDFLMSFSLKK